MKKFFSFVIAACALFLFYSCEKQEQINDSSNFNGTLVFSSAKPEMADESGTRTVWTGSSVKWKAGDKIRVGFTLDGVWQSGIEGDTTPRLFASNDLNENKDIAEFSIPTVASGNTSFQANYIQSLEGDLVFYGLYPSSCTSSATQTNAPEISITVPADQKPTAESFDPSADILIGKTQTLDATPTDPVLMDWSRIVALADITLKELNVEDGESLLRLTLTAQEGADLVGNHSLNLEELTVSSPAGTTNEITLNVSSLAISSDNTLEVWVGLLPATITSLTVVLETNAATYTRTISGFSKTFVKNKRNLLGIKMTGATRVAKTNVNPYELLETSNVTLNTVVDGNGSDAKVNGNTAIKVGTASKGGKMSVTVPAGSTKLHLHAAAWKDVTGLSLNISGANIDPTSIALTADNGVTGNSPFTLSGSVDDYYYVINLSGITAETEITFESSISKRFVVWGVNVEPEPAVVNTPTLTFNDPTTTVNVGTTVTNTATIDPSGLTVTYSSGDESVATVDATTGEVTGVAPGTATITATFAGNSQYATVSASYTITVPAALSTIAALNASATATAASFTANLTNAVISFVPDSKNAVIKDATGSVLVFYKDGGLTLKQGQTLTGNIAGTIILYNEAAEITSLTEGSFTGNETVVDPETVTLDALVGHFTEYQNAYVMVENLTVSSVSGRNISVKNAAGNKTYVVYVPSDVTCNIGDVITVVGTVAHYGNNDQIKVWKAADLEVVSSAVATPVISCTNNTVTITCATEGATIYYTTNGDTPTSSSSVYSVPFALTETVTVKAIAVKSNLLDSGVASQVCTYVSGDAPDPVSMNIYSNQATVTGTGAAQTATWTQEDITVTAVRNDATNTQFRNSDTDHTRFYKGWTITVSSAANSISSVEFTCTDNSYANALAGMNFSAGAVSASSTKVTVSGVSAPSTSVTLSGQVRVSGIKVYYE